MDERLDHLACKLVERITPFIIRERVIVQEADSNQPGPCGRWFATKLQELLFKEAIPDSKEMEIRGHYLLDDPHKVLLSLRASLVKSGGEPSIVKFGGEPAVVEIPREELPCLKEPRLQAVGLARMPGFGKSRQDREDAEVAARVAARAALLTGKETPPVRNRAEIPPLLRTFSLGVVFDEHDQLTTPPRETGQVSLRLEGRRLLPEGQKQWITARYDNDSELFESGQEARLIVTNRHTRPLYLGACLWDDDDTVTRYLPIEESAAPMLEPNRSLEKKELPHLAFCPRHGDEAVGMVLLVASTRRDFDFRALCPRMVGANLAGTFENGTPWTSLTDALSQVREDYSLVALPYRVLGQCPVPGPGGLKPGRPALPGPGTMP
ncbi:MAG: hypothetical protein HQL56_13270 [Magnetococcales bacterium]|nr:hypothetical protein [Magnetococcales bacterium]